MDLTQNSGLDPVPNGLRVELQDVGDVLDGHVLLIAGHDHMGKLAVTNAAVTHRLWF
jgi:hypothetical protein